VLSGAAIDPGLKYGMDFNPVADAAGAASLRLVSSAGSNYAVNANSGVIGNTASMIPANFGEVAYTNSNPAGSMAPHRPSCITSISSATSCSSPTAHSTRRPSAWSARSGSTPSARSGFDILADGSAYASLTSSITGQGGLYSIDLGTGSATLLGGFGASSPLLAGLTAAPVPEPGTYALMLSSLGLIAFAVRRRQRQPG
jgi:PEP-CTERM putative exosortase interaction domain